MASINRSAFGIVGAALACALSMTAALAGPPKTKKPVKKPVMAKADPVAGKKVYAANGCAGCHAISGEGGQSGPDLTKFAEEKEHDAKWTTVQVQDPKKHKPDSGMPGYADKIKGKDLANLTAYLLTLK